jgi:hypothetical protein
MQDGPNRPSHEVAATDFVVATVNLNWLSVRDGKASHTLPTADVAIFGQ